MEVLVSHIYVLYRDESPPPTPCSLAFINCAH